TVNQANPVVTTWPTASAITYGQTLASSSLTGGAATPAGGFAFTTPFIAPNAGSTNVSVTYTPTDATDYNSISNTVSLTVNQAATTTALGSSLNPSTNGNNVIFTATVAPAATSGTVTFLDGATTLGTGALSSGVATYATSALSVGDHAITAQYGGNGNYSGSTSTVLTQTVNAVPAVPPTQTIAISGGNVVIDWPTNAPGYSVISNGDLTTPAGGWGTAGTGSVVGTNYEITLPMGAGTTFFRLKK
ncbi:MAG: Ig-like domain-containing protein, partial [Verrucomicrobiota bacterium]